jgi:hypothetical protein
MKSKQAAIISTQGPSAAQLKTRDEKTFHHKERKDHRKKVEAGFQPAADQVKKHAQGDKSLKDIFCRVRWRTDRPVARM